MKRTHSIEYISSNCKSLKRCASDIALSHGGGFNYDDKFINLPKHVRLYYIVSSTDCTKYSAEILRLSSSGWTVWGFDIEWWAFSPNGQGKVALIQFCRDDVILLFHICCCGLQPKLIEVLRHPHVFKIGVNISGDMKKLERDFSFLYGLTDGACELNSILRHCEMSPCHGSLADLVLGILGKELAKPKHIRCGNWEKKPLSKSQINYAALDAYVSYKILEASILKLSMDPSKLESNKVKLTLDVLNSCKIRKSADITMDKTENSALSSISTVDVTPSVCLLECIRELYCKVIPAAKEFQVLSTINYAYYVDWMTGKSMSDIASAKGVKIRTVTSSIVDLIAKGCAYDFSRLEISEVIFKNIICAYLKYISPEGNLQEVEPTADDIPISSIMSLCLKIDDAEVPNYWHIKAISAHLCRCLGIRWLDKIRLLQLQECAVGSTSTNPVTALPATPPTEDGDEDTVCFYIV